MTASTGEFEVDLFVIGGGSGGVRAARMAGAQGARVALAEARGIAGLGGTCVNLGCIPKKLYSYAAHYAEAFEESRGFGWDWAGEPPRLDWARLKENRRQELARLNQVYARLLAGSGVELLAGHARLVDAHTVEVGYWRDGERPPRRVRARHILVATGGEPRLPELPGREHVMSSDQVFDVDPFPARLLVVGGGYIACEFASIFTGLGARVTQLYRGEQILRGFDDDIRAFLAAEMIKKGVDLRLQANVAAIRKSSAGLEVELADGGKLVVDAVLAATGRSPRVAGLGLAEAGVAQAPDGAVLVDEHFRSSIPSILAVGDVISRVQLTPVALAEAMLVVEQLFGPDAGRPARDMSYDCIPTAVFTHPSVATVGLTEVQARERFGAVRVFRTEFRPLRHTLSRSSERTLMKLVVEAASDRVVGLHMVGAEAGEIVQGFAVAMKGGATKALFDQTIGIHPTAAEEFVTLRDPVPD